MWRWRYLVEMPFLLLVQGALPDGQEVAVKRLSESTTQGLGQMKNELALIAKLQYKMLELISWPDPTIEPDP